MVLCYYEKSLEFCIQRYVRALCKEDLGLMLLFFSLSIARSSPGRKPASLEHRDCKQESGTSNRGNSLVRWFVCLCIYKYVYFCLFSYH